MPNYFYRYKTPEAFDDIILKSDGEVLTALLFEGSKNVALHDCEERDLPIFSETFRWLDIYFGGRKPDFTPRYLMENFTPFRKEVSEIMTEIPFGQTMTYGEIAAKIARRHGVAKMSAQAVGGAVGWNPVCIIVPCHRVVGSNGNLTGYGGGMKNKIALLQLEGLDLGKFAVPKNEISLSYPESQALQTHL
ncbi:MAG: methylated-DNA--[Bacteroidaceae bacterium]|nr:methylated-DNA--[protein]-cysteine S-methyltransferase [Bacteroidaceae bacterium]